MPADLDQVHPLGLLDDGLQLGRGERVHEASLGHDEQHELHARED